jgi:dTDP-4-amino-4,6-dideoxygalactose transaminase
MNSGTDAITIGLRTLGVRPGDEVITTSFTFFATTEGIHHAGATPVFADIDPQTCNLDVSQIEAKITPHTKVILPGHLYGHSTDMVAIMTLARDHNLKVLEDVAQAFGGMHDGRKLGTMGDASAFSFFPSKNLGA